MVPALITLDVFGAVLDWARGLQEALTAAGHPVTDTDIERLIDWQGVTVQQEPQRPYRSLTAESLVEVMGLDQPSALAIGQNLGTWPLFADSAEGLARLARMTPCVALANGDRTHRAQIECQLGFELFDWMFAADLGCYKPSFRFWQETASRLGVDFGRDWWHVSAYADQDLEMAGSLGLTCVFLRRRHCRAGPAHLSVPSLTALADRLQGRAPSGNLPAASGKTTS
jgi:HAD superfamily hydrolase (TIGR01493 family)